MFEDQEQRHDLDCSYCGRAVNVHFGQVLMRPEYDVAGIVYSGLCPSCNGLIIYLTIDEQEDNDYTEFLAYPRHGDVFQKPVPEEIPDSLRSDYIESRLILEYSPKASAALSRRVFQSLIRDKEGIQERTLYREIDKLLKLNKLPSYLADVVDGIRHYGNFAAHPSEDSVTGEIIDVEPGEAEWLLEILNDLFDFYFVQPKKAQERKDNLNKKLASAGKRPMA